MTVRDNREQQRFELVEGGSVIGIAEYHWDDGRLVFPHTEILPARRGEGRGAVLVRDALDQARAQGITTIVPRCWYVAQFIRDHPEYADLVGEPQSTD